MNAPVDNVERGYPNRRKNVTQRVPAQQDDLPSEKRHRIYKMMNLSVIGHGDGSLEVTWPYGDRGHRSNGEASPLGSCRIQGR